MDRRDFIKLASLAGMSVAGAPLLGRAEHGEYTDPGRPQALGDDYQGPLFVAVQAHGGWDPTMLCDPKGNALNQSFGEGDIGTAGNLRYAPIASAKAFFDANYSRMMVINGVDTSTNAHDAGQRNCVSGRLGEGYPNIAALAAGVGAPQRPMSFISFGPYDRTGGLVAPVRNGNQERLSDLSFPERMNAVDPAGGSYHTPYAHEIIRLAREKRAADLQKRNQLPRFKNAMSSMLTARSGSKELQNLQAVLPEPNANPLLRQAELVVAAYKAGIGVAGNLFHSNFDTHSDHDNAQGDRMNEIVGLVSFLWQEAERQGVADKLCVLMCSDFGRTPQYNGANGKDHWSITSMIAMGAGIPGNRVVGQTDGGHNAMLLDPATLQPTTDAAKGVRLSPAHVHRGLRRLLGIEGTAADDMFPLSIDDELDPFKVV
jgi:hypothetical protein